MAASFSVTNCVTNTGQIHVTAKNTGTAAEFFRMVKTGDLNFGDILTFPQLAPGESARGMSPNDQEGTTLSGDWVKQYFHGVWTTIGTYTMTTNACP